MSKKKIETAVDEREYHVLSIKAKTRSVSLATATLYPRWYKANNRYFIEEQPWMGTEGKWYNWDCWTELQHSPLEGLHYKQRSLRYE